VKQHAPVYSSSKPRPGFSTTPYPVSYSVEFDNVAINLIDTPALMKEYLDNDDSTESQRLRVQDMLLRNKGKIERVKDSFTPGVYSTSRRPFESYFYILLQSNTSWAEARLRI